MTQNISLHTRLGGVILANPLMNAAGCRCTTKNDLRILQQQDLGAIVTKTMTLTPCDGNVKPRYGETADGTINANGLCNAGFDAYCTWYRNFGAPAHLFFSISAMHLQPFELMLRTLSTMPTNQQPRLVEVNVSCPNLPGHGNGMLNLPHLSDVLALLHFIGQRMENTRFGLKLPPLFFLSLTKQVSDIISQYTHVVSFVTCSNSLPKGFLIDPNTDQPFLNPNDGFGGVGGTYMKPVALAEVRRFRHCLPKQVQVVGCGGVKTGRDVYDLLLAGADIVQVGSTLMKDGPSCFARLQRELTDILRSKGYHNVDKVPRLKFLSPKQ